MGWRGGGDQKELARKGETNKRRIEIGLRGIFPPPGQHKKQKTKEILARVREYARDALRNMECLNYKESQLSSYFN